MTEGHESDFLVKVRAQVMTRDESTEGWLPLPGGGLANVSIRKRTKLSPGGNGHEYIIYGQRITDQNIILSCAINRDLKYYKVMPTFHHWLAGKQRNGLTFQTAADARTFDKGVRRAFNELIDGMAETNPSWPQLAKYDSVGEDEVFMTLDLPIDTETQTSPESSEKISPTASNGKDRDSEKEKACIHYISSDKPGPPSQLMPRVEPPLIAPSENYSYVTLTVHDYNYPVVDQPAAAQVLNARRESISNLKKRTTLETSVDSPVVIDSLKISAIGKNNRVRCRYCHELYLDDFNRKGACEYAPDNFKTGFEFVSGMGCARCMLYHCMSDAEGETASHPCECINESGCTKRWIGLALLSLVVPCLWCYPPLRACHLVGISCGVCGGKHKPQV